jgi:hypothetical protein
LAEGSRLSPSTGGRMAMYTYFRGISCPLCVHSTSWRVCATKIKYVTQLPTCALKRWGSLSACAALLYCCTYACV